MAGYSGPAKKPRLENCYPSTSAATSNSDEWGDDFAISVDQLKKIDFIESQAFSQADPPKVTTQLRHSVSASSIPREKRLSLSGENSKGTISLEEFYAPVERTKKLYNYKPIQYPQSRNSVTSLSGFAKDIGDADDSPLQSDQASDARQNSKTPARVEPKNSLVSNELWIKGQESLKMVIKKQEEELEKYKMKLKKFQEDDYAHTGELKLLRDTLTRKDAELIQEKQQHLQALEKWREERNEAILESNKKIQSLQTELQFKSQELLEIQSKYQLLELKAKSFDTRPPALDNSHISRSAAQRNLNSFSPKKSRVFPKCEDWDIPKAVTTDATVQTEVVKVTRNILPLKYPKGQLSGPKIISQLFPNNPDEMDAFDVGLMPVIHKNNLSNQQSKEKSIRTISPSWISLPVSEQENATASANQLFALSGITRLLLSDSVDVDKLQSTVVTFFPIIEEAVNRYLTLLTEQQRIKSKSNIPTSGNYDHHPLSAKFSSLLHFNFVNWSETEQTLTSSLKLLTKLINLLPGTADIILCNGKSAFSVKQDKEFLLSTLPSLYVSKPSQSSLAPLQNLVALVQLLITVKLDVSNGVIEACLEVLYTLLSTADKLSIVSMQNLLPNIFENWISNRANVSVVVFSLQIATCLMNLPEISCDWLQTHNELSCPFSLLGKLGQEAFTAFPSSNSKMMVIQEMISFLSVLFRQQDIKSCLHDADENSCLMDLIAGLVEALSQVITIYKQTHSVKDLNFIRSASMLLHQLSSLDAHFSKHRSIVQRQYVLLINQITRLWKDVKDELNPWEVIAIQELNEFSLDESEEFISKQECSASNTGCG